MVNHDDGWMVIRQSASEQEVSPLLLLCLRCGSFGRGSDTDTASCGVIRLADESTDTTDNEPGLYCGYR